MGDPVSDQLIEAEIVHVMGEDVRQNPRRATYSVHWSRRGKYVLRMYMGGKQNAQMDIGTRDNRITIRPLNDAQWSIVERLAVEVEELD